jgi:hypothetical protein
MDQKSSVCEATFAAIHSAVEDFEGGPGLLKMPIGDTTCHHRFTEITIFIEIQLDLPAREL